MTDKHKRSGSALVVVLGMLAVIMLMAVAFSIYMRTERAGTTNLRHALVAKQMMQSAIARTMQSIDDSFGDPRDNWAAPYWEEPYLTSFTNDAKPYLSAPWSNDAQRAASARILTREMMMRLTPSQLALAKQANIGWARINAGVSSSPGQDSVLGRYAFIAFDVSGLLDMNKAGGGPVAARATDFATNAANYQVEDSLFFTSASWLDGTDQKAKPADYAKFISARNTRPFLSMADFWRRIGIASGPESYDWDGQDPALPIAADLFAPFSMSLEGLAPDGSMKLPLVALQTDAQKKAYAKLAVESFRKVFEEAGDDLRFGFKNQGLKFTRAELATQALIDYLDADDIPSGGIATYKADGSIEDARGSEDGYLNFPCTEPVPMVTWAMAYFFTKPDTNTKLDEPPTPVQPDPGDWRTWYREYDVYFKAVCVAQYLNDKVPENLASKSYKLKMEFEFADLSALMAPLWGAGWKAGGQANGWKVDLINPEFLSEIQSVEGAPASAVAGSARARKFSAQTPDVHVLKVKAYKKSEFGDYHEFSSPLEGPAADSIRTEVRIKAQVLSGGKIVQQVPCPILEKNTRDDYRIRVSPGLYRKPAEAARATETLEQGWAMCVDPRFAYNTESVVDFTGATGYRFWVDNMLAHEDLPSSSPPDPTMVQTAQMLLDEELAGTLDMPDLGSALIKNVFFSEQAPGAVKAIADMWSNGVKAYPDAFHSSRKGGDTFMKTDLYDAEASLLKTRIANLPMVSPGELGNLLVGPWETLSLFATFKPGAAPADIPVFHRALDYFCMGQARDPTLAELASKKLADLKQRHLAALQTGRVNLNPPRLVYPVQNDTRYGRQKLDADGYPEYNGDPLAAVMTGAGINQDQAEPTPLDVDTAKTIAAKFYEQAKAWEVKGLDRGALMISRLSDLGQCNVATNANPVLEALMSSAGPTELNIKCDAHREALIANTVNALTVRGQSFLVLIRAEAFSPQDGSDSPENGTTLSTTYAIVELWRDPEPARKPDGSLYPDSDTPFHPWAIRSIRWF